MEEVKGRGIPEWLEFDASAMTGQGRVAADKGPDQPAGAGAVDRRAVFEVDGRDAYTAGQRTLPVPERERIDSMLWKGFQRPKRLEFDAETLTDRFGRFYAQPFERGFGTTIGNALRRVLLSAIEGAAVTSVKIDKVLHEFSPIPGVVEDATDIILNLKQIPIKLRADQTKTLYLRADKPGEVKASDLKVDAGVEILEPDLHIATVGEGGSAAHGDACEAGDGATCRPTGTSTRIWVSAGSRSTRCIRRYARSTIRWRPLDSAQTTDYDKLTVDVWTDGTVTARDAISLSAKLVRDPFEHLHRSRGTGRRADRAECGAGPVGGERASRQER